MTGAGNWIGTENVVRTCRKVSTSVADTKFPLAYYYVLLPYTVPTIDPSFVEYVGGFAGSSRRELPRSCGSARLSSLSGPSGGIRFETDSSFHGGLGVLAEEDQLGSNGCLLET